MTDSSAFSTASESLKALAISDESPLQQKSSIPSDQLSWRRAEKAEEPVVSVDSSDQPYRPRSRRHSQSSVSSDKSSSTADLSEERSLFQVPRFHRDNSSWRQAERPSRWQDPRVSSSESATWRSGTQEHSHFQSPYEPRSDITTRRGDSSPFQPRREEPQPFRTFSAFPRYPKR